MSYTPTTSAKLEELEERAERAEGYPNLTATVIALVLIELTRQTKRIADHLEGAR